MGKIKVQVSIELGHDCVGWRKSVLSSLVVPCFSTSELAIYLQLKISSTTKLAANLKCPHDKRHCHAWKSLRTLLSLAPGKQSP
jgi:hypothetical protein